MNRLRRVVGNTIISLIGQAVTWTSTLLLTIAYGRFLGDAKFGELYFALTFVMLIGFPIESGFNQQLTRDVAQEPGKALRYLANILCIKFLLWVLLYSSILLICWKLGYSDELRLLVSICGVALLSGSIANTFNSLHCAFERVVFPTVGTILEKGSTALVGILLLRQGAGVQVMAYILLGGSLANACWQAAWAFRLLGIRLRLDFALTRELLRASIPFLVYGVIGVIYYRIDTILLSLMASTTVVGWYGASYRVFDTLVFLPSLVISAIMYPVFSKLSRQSSSELKIAVEKSLNFLLFCGVPISTGLIVAAPELIGFLYHRTEFLPAIPSLQALAPGLLFLYINSVLGSMLMSTKREKYITIMAAIALVFNLGLNLLLIPRYAHIGAAAVTSLTELLLLILASIFSPRALFPTGSIKVGLKALVASLAMAAAIWFTRGYGLVVLLLAAAVTYFAVATLLGTIPREDMRALVQSVRRKGQKMPEVGETPIQVEDIEVFPEESLALPLPETETNIAWRSEWTDPALVTLGREIRELAHNEYTEDESDVKTQPLPRHRPFLPPGVRNNESDRDTFLNDETVKSPAIRKHWQEKESHTAESDEVIS